MLILICHLLIFTLVFHFLPYHLIVTFYLRGLFNTHFMYYHRLCVWFNISLAQGTDPDILIQLHFICQYEEHLCHWHRQHRYASCVQMSMYYIQSFSFQLHLITPKCFVLRNAGTMKLSNGYALFCVCLSAICVYFFNCACPLNITSKYALTLLNYVMIHSLLLTAKSDSFDTVNSY